MFRRTYGSEGEKTGEHDERLSAALREWKNIEPPAHFNATVWRCIRTAAVREPGSPPALVALREWLMTRPAWANAMAAAAGIVLGVGCWLLVGYVTMNTHDRDEVSVVNDAEALLRRAVRDGRFKLPAGYYWEWSGQFENQVRAMARMRILVPVTLLIMFVMLYLGFRRWWIAPLIFFGVLVSASGGFLMLALWGANLSVAVWVGFLVLFGVVDDDGVVMATYLEELYDRLPTSKTSNA